MVLKYRKLKIIIIVNALIYICTSAVIRKSEKNIGINQKFLGVNERSNLVQIQEIVENLPETPIFEFPKDDQDDLKNINIKTSQNVNETSHLLSVEDKFLFKGGISCEPGKVLVLNFNKKYVCLKDSTA